MDLLQLNDNPVTYHDIGESHVFLLTVIELDFEREEFIVNS